MFVGIEAGGTTFVVGISEGPTLAIIKKDSFVTEKPIDTLAKIINWIKAETSSIQAIGIASFGPVDLDLNSSTYGCITSTPKLEWQNFNLVGHIKSAFPNVPVGFDTDVNAAALAELNLPVNLPINNKFPPTLCYITVGTGVGVGIVVNGSPIHGLIHPEAGHLLVRTQEGDHTFSGCCPFHGKMCVEGNVSSQAIAVRAQTSRHSLADLEDSHPVWDTAGFYLAQLCANLLLTLSPRHIIFGGGVMKRSSILPAVRKYTLQLLNQYLAHPLLTEEEINKVITFTDHGQNAGLLGSLFLAKEAAALHVN
eukprot:GCRY01002836.1.p1 GENE.GCRY01002836.1~~GCRY01002836.1.p1  ORF type:complete len:327 (+),score=35.80 GCRY01002836.1:57-983(+)